MKKIRIKLDFYALMAVMVICATILVFITILVMK